MHDLYRTDDLMNVVRCHGTHLSSAARASPNAAFNAARLSIFLSGPSFIFR